MRKVSIRDLHIRTSELVREASQGTVIEIQRRGESVAELRPITRKKKKAKLRDLAEFWASMPQLATDSAQFISADRDRCS